MCLRCTELLPNGGPMSPADLLVDVTGDDGTSRRNVPLREAVGNDDEEYQDCRETLLADGHCTTGGGDFPLYHMELVRNAGTARTKDEVPRRQVARLRAGIRKAADSTRLSNRVSAVRSSRRNLLFGEVKKSRGPMHRRSCPSTLSGGGLGGRRFRPSRRSHCREASHCQSSSIDERIPMACRSFSCAVAVRTD